MRTWIYFIKAPIRTISIKRQQQTYRFRRQMVYIKKSLAQEKTETVEMLDIYKRYTLKQASKAEMKEANQQFVDIIKGLGIGVVAVLPFAPITIPVVIKLGKYVGVDILPSSFYNEKNKAE